MDSIPRPWRAGELRAGGKMVRSRRTARTTTPYDRPELPPNSSPENPNWLSRFIYSPTRMIASGTGKIISSVFTNESSSSSSSSSSGSEDEINDENDDNDISSETTETMKKNGTSENIQRITSEPLPTAEKSQTKHLIAQLLKQVTFSREECDRLTSIIKSRVVDGPVIRDTKDQSLTEQPNITIGSDVDMPDLCSAAVMEAKKWLEEKKLGSSPKSELEHGPRTLNSAMLLHITEGEAGSPVDMAKSYMQTRRPWASPSVTPTEYRSASSTGIQLFKEEIPYSTRYTSLTSSKMKRDSPASASWNILDEIRKVRSKATEEMLRTPPSSKIDWSSFVLENKSDTNAFAADAVEASMRNNVHSSRKPLDASVNLATGVSTLYGIPVSQMTQDRLQNETVLPNPATFVSDQNQDLENIQSREETIGRLSSGQRGRSLEGMKTVTQSDGDAANIDGLKDTNGTSQPFNFLAGGTAEGLNVVLALNAVPDSRNNQNCSTSKEMAGKDGLLAVNGFPSSGFSLSAGQDREGNSGPSDGNQNPASSGHDEVQPSVHTEQDCQLLSEASVDVPVTRENENFATGSQNSSSMQNEGLSYNLTTPNSRHHGKYSGTAERQLERKPSRYGRRVRGRGK